MKLTLIATLLTLSLVSFARVRTVAVAATQPTTSHTLIQFSPDDQTQISAIGGGATNPWRSPYKTA